MKKEIKRCEKLESSLISRFTSYEDQAQVQKSSLNILNVQREELSIKKSIYEVALAQESKSLDSRCTELK